MTVKRPWVISIPPVKCPDDLTGIPESYIDAWERYVCKVEPQGGDREDWVETCSRLYWGVRNLGLDAIVRVHGDAGVDPTKLVGLPHLGQVMNHPAIDQYADPSQADRYASNPNIRMLMHRHTRLSSVHGDDIEQAFRALCDEGVSSFLVKFAHRSKRLPNLRITGNDPGRLAQQVSGWLDESWDSVNAEDDPNALLIQENVDMRYEYRVFMVGDEPACGAGNIGLMTPLDNTARFDPKMQRKRDDSTVENIESRPDLAEQYREFAVRAGRLLSHCGYGAYSLDLCLIGGEVSVVELNGMMNSGLFAADMNALTGAMRIHPEQFVPPTLTFPNISERSTF